MSAIHVADLCFRYPSPLLDGNPIEALRSVDLEVEAGEFVALMGPIGAGKTTLCLALNGAIPHAVDGKFEGRVTVCGQDTRDTSMGQLAMQVGLVFEDAEAQLFNATVADEIAFGLESMALPPVEIERRIDAALELVDLVGFRQRSPRTLSGGEQKRLALASVLAMQPRVLILDEPTSGLDSHSRYAVLAAIDRLRRKRGHEMTVVMATQDAEAAARFADRIFVLHGGQIALAGSPADVFGQIEKMDEWGLGVPQLARLAHRLNMPIAFRPEDAMQAWGSALQYRVSRAITPALKMTPSEPLIEVRDLSHDYPASEQPALRNVTLDILRGEWLAVIGVNGSGKSTFLKHLNGLLKPTRGTVRVEGHDTRARQVGELARTVSYLPQNPDQSIFCPTVRDEVAYGPRKLGVRGEALDARVAETLERLHLDEYVRHPPAVLGYGLRRQVALASVLAMDAPVLALDEPAVGLDRGTVTRLMDAVSRRHQRGTTVVMISHDLQLVSRYAQRVAALDKGCLVAQGPTHEVLSDIALVKAIGLEPLPVTTVAHLLGWPPPLPLGVKDWGGDG